MARRGNCGGHQTMGEQFEREEWTRNLQRMEERLAQLVKDRMDTITELVTQKLGGPKGSTRQHNHQGLPVKVEAFNYLRYEEIEPLFDIESCSEELGEGIGLSEWPEGGPVYDDYDETFEETTEQLQEHPLSWDSEPVDSVDGGSIEVEMVLSSSPEVVDDNSDAEIRYVLDFSKDDSCNGVLDISSQRLVKRENVSLGSAIYLGALELRSDDFESKGKLSMLSKDLVEVEIQKFEEAHGSEGRLSEKYAYPMQHVVGDAEILFDLTMKERQERIFERGKEKETPKQGTTQKRRHVELGVVAEMSHTSISSTAGIISRFNLSTLSVFCPLKLGRYDMYESRLGAMMLNVVEASCGGGVLKKMADLKGLKGTSHVVDVVCWYDDELGSLVGEGTVGSSGGDDVLAPERGIMLGYIETKDMVVVRELFDKIPGQDIMARDTVLNGVAITQPNEYGSLRDGPAELMTELRRSDLFDPGGKIPNVVGVSYGGGILGKVVVVRGEQVGKSMKMDGVGFYCSSGEDIWHSSNSRSNSVQPEENDADKGLKVGGASKHDKGIWYLANSRSNSIQPGENDADPYRMNDANKGHMKDADKGQGNEENDVDEGQTKDANKSHMKDADKGQRNDADKDQRGQNEELQSRESTMT